MEEEKQETEIEQVSESTATKPAACRRSKRAKKRYGEFKLESLDQFPYRSEALTLAHAEAVSVQLGYIPTNLVEVGSFDEHTHKPQTLILYGLNENSSIKGRYATGKMQPFPTMVWMSCPVLKAQISKLEVDGLVDIFEERLNCDGVDTADISIGSDDLTPPPPTFLDRMHRAHQQYASERWTRFSDEHKEYVESQGWVENLRDVGVAGIREFNHVKCLHCHYAHFLARPQHDNVIGQWVHAEMIRRGFTGAGDVDGEVSEGIVMGGGGGGEEEEEEMQKSVIGEEDEGGGASKIK
jgi:hypothetical protein